MRQAGAYLGARIELDNSGHLVLYREEGIILSKGVKALFGATAVAAIIALVSYCLIAKFTSPNMFREEPSTIQQKLDLVRAERDPGEIMKDRCIEMHSSATQLEGTAQESSSEIEWNSHLDTMGSVFHAAYAQTHAGGIQNITSREIMNWGVPAPSPTQRIIPIHSTMLDRQEFEEEKILAQEHWSFNEFLRPLSLQLELTAAHRDNVHEASFAIIQNSTAFSFGTDSDRFKKVYATYFARMDMPRGCFKYFREPKDIAARYKAGRENQTIQDSETAVAFETYFAARSALPETPPAPSLELPDSSRDSNPGAN